MKIYGLVGKNIDYSFSKKYFTDFFESAAISDCFYQNFDLEKIEEFPQLLLLNPNIVGLNVTVPYKQTIIPYLHSLSKKTAEIGAVNVIRLKESGKMKGYNTDYLGFKRSIELELQPHHKKALILGTGGSSKAIAFAFNELQISCKFVSRKKTSEHLHYEDLAKSIFDEYQIIVNCTPVGTFPNIGDCPPIPYQYFTSKHLAYDLIYNPEETLFLQKAKSFGAQTKNGLEMLVKQAEESWQIWNK